MKEGLVRTENELILRMRLSMIRAQNFKVLHDLYYQNQVCLAINAKKNNNLTECFYAYQEIFNRITTDNEFAMTLSGTRINRLFWNLSRLGLMIGNRDNDLEQINESTEMFESCVPVSSSYNRQKEIGVIYKRGICRVGPERFFRENFKLETEEGWLKECIKKLSDYL